MANAELGPVVQQLRRLTSANVAREWTDGELVQHFATDRDDSAFAAIMQRYGPLVLAVCRRVLGNEADAEDAFQATFLVLARSAGGICKGEALAGWLYGVAYHMASKAKRSAVRRRNHERQAPVPSAKPTSELALRELQAILDEEVRRLPEVYRTPFVLCCLEGYSKIEAARRLCWKEGTVSGRLARARRQLQKRLLARGVSLTATLAAVALGEGAVRAAVAPVLASTTAQAAVLYGSKQGLPAGLVSAQVIHLARGATNAMLLKPARLALLLIALLGALGAGAMALPGRGAMPPVDSPAATRDEATPPPSGQAPPPPAKGDAAGAVTVAGRVLGPDDKPVAGARLYWPHLRKEPPTRPEDIALTVRATTDAEGRFRFELPRKEVQPSWDIPLIAHADGLSVGGAELPKSGPATDLTLRLVRDQPIQGRVLDTQGKPVAGVRAQVVGVLIPPKGQLDGFLTAWKREWQLSGQQFSQRLHVPLGDVLRTAPTDRDGRFQINGGGVERVVLLDLNGPGVAGANLWIVNRRGFDGKSINKEVEGRIPAALRQPGQPPLLYGPRFDYVVEPAREIEGTVREVGNDKPLAGIRLQALTGYNTGTGTVSDSRGHYRLTGLPKLAEYRLHAMPSGESWLLQRLVRVPDKAGVGPIHFDIELARGVVVNGRVLDRATGKGVKAGIRFVPLPDNSYFGKPGYDSYRYERLMNPTGEDGRFHLAILPGSGVLMAQVYGGVERIDGLELNPYKLAAFDEAGRKRVQVVDDSDGDGGRFTAAGGALEFLGIENAVKVIDSTPNTGTVTCDLVLERGQTQSVNLCDANGKPLTGVVVSGLTASWPKTFSVRSASCKVLALDPDRPRQLVFLHVSRNLAGTLTVRGDEKEPLTARLVPTGTVIGRVLDQDGQPLSGAEVDLSFPGGIAGELYRHVNAGRAHLRTGADGRFRLDGVVPDLKFALSIQKGRIFLRGEPRIGMKQVGPGQTLDVGEVRTKPQQ
jgi:RNA polymerase sigma factor (sigma-70 family)